MCYLGGMIAIGAMTLFMALGWERRCLAEATWITQQVLNLADFVPCRDRVLKKVGRHGSSSSFAAAKPGAAGRDGARCKEARFCRITLNPAVTLPL